MLCYVMLCYGMLCFASRTPTLPQTRLNHAIEVKRNTLLSTFGSRPLFEFWWISCTAPFNLVSKQNSFVVQTFFYNFPLRGSRFSQISFTHTVLYYVDIAAARRDFGRWKIMQTFICCKLMLFPSHHSLMLLLFVNKYGILMANFSNG